MPQPTTIWHHRLAAGAFVWGWTCQAVSPKKVGVRQTILIFSPCTALGTPRLPGLRSNVTYFLGPLEGKGEAAISHLLPAPGIGSPRDCAGYVAGLPFFGPR